MSLISLWIVERAVFFRLCLGLIHRACMMFFVGEKIKQIKVACSVDCAAYFYEKKNFKKALSHYQKALLLDSNDFYANMGLAQTFVASKLFKESLVYFNKANSIRKPDASTLLSLFIVHKALGDNELATEVLQEMLGFFKGYEAAGYDALAYTYFFLEMFEESEFYSREALKISPNEGGLHYNLGKVYFAEQKIKEARAEFQRAVELVHGKKERHLKSYAIRYLEEIGRKETSKYIPMV